MASSSLIGPAGLHDLLQSGAPDVKLLDASYNLPPSDIRIGNALAFDIDDIADEGAQLPHTLPSDALFAERVGALGIGNDSRVIVYDRSGLAMAASRAWWMFRVFGHENVQVLDGGLPAWASAGYPVQQGPAPRPEPAVFQTHFRPELFKAQKDILLNIEQKNFTLIDARDAARYTGDAAEPRPGLESGHIPGSLNVPFMSLLDPATGGLKPLAELQEIFKGLDAEKPVAASCGSGVTACVIALALHRTGREDVAVYDGSWTEWGANPALPKHKGEEA
jgi:thiosulfate/3-mercaptopyruvate sulfurtransferase